MGCGYRQPDLFTTPASRRATYSLGSASFSSQIASVMIYGREAPRVFGNGTGHCTCGVSTCSVTSTGSPAGWPKGIILEVGRHQSTALSAQPFSPFWGDLIHWSGLVPVARRSVFPVRQHHVAKFSMKRSETGAARHARFPVIS
jgi:hypothetical protein